MGRNKHHGRRGKHVKTTEQKPQKSEQQRTTEHKERGSTDYKKTLKQNPEFEIYYQAQEIVPDGEWSEFMESLRRPLPSAFRITGSKTQAHELLKLIKSDFFDKLCDVEVEGRIIRPPKCLSWYPDEMAWQLDLDRNFIRHSEMLSKLHAFLIEETESGNISRQESVSMIPPLLMDIKPHHKVLDMCAAPGSKTAQLIEILHAGDTNLVPEGCVVANDSDNKRCYLMTHQVKRLQSPNFLIINQDATCMPNFKLPNDEFPGTKKAVRFDRILADVPCSGDGTFRKNIDAWQKWHQHKSMQLHHIQKRILNRGLEMLDVGGRLVYSTCSMNPIEDEAVIASLLRKCEGSIHLVDVGESLPGLKFLAGKSTWKVIARDMEEYDKVDSVPDHLKSTIRPSVFPPTPEETEQFQLQKCIRVLPHHQDTGGFFIGVLEKTAEVPWVKFSSKERTRQLPTNISTTEENQQTVGNGEANKNGQGEGTSEANKDDTSEAVPKLTEPDSDGAVQNSPQEGAGETAASQPTEGSVDPNQAESGEKRKGEEQQWQEGKRQKIEKKGRRRGYKEDPFIYLDQNDDIWAPIEEFYGLKEFPADQLLVRCEEGKKRHVYFTSKLVKSLVANNLNVMKIINTGLKIFSRSDSPYTTCPFRTVQDGVAILNTYVTKRTVTITKDDIVTLLSTEMPFLSKFTKHIQDQLSVLPQGSVIFIYDPSTDSRPDSPKCPMVLCGWLGKTSCRSFIALNDRGHYLRLCGAPLLSKEDRMKQLEEFKQKSTSTPEDCPVKDEDELPKHGIESQFEGVLGADNHNMEDNAEQESSVN